MQFFIDKANHNQEFLDCINQNFPNSYFDWKAAIIFYIALHFMKAFVIKKTGKTYNNHTDLDKAINPAYGNTVLSQSTYDDYHSLYQYARTARYTGISNVSLFEGLMRSNYKLALDNLKNIKKYINSNGLKI